MAVVNSINNLQQNVGVINSGRFTPQQNVGDVNKSTRVAGQSQDNLVNLATSKAQYEDHQNDMFAHQRNVALQAYIAYGRQGAEAIDGAQAVTTTADDITDTSAAEAYRAITGTDPSVSGQAQQATAQQATAQQATIQPTTTQPTSTSTEPAARSVSPVATATTSNAAGTQDPAANAGLVTAPGTTQAQGTDEASKSEQSNPSATSAKGLDGQELTEEEQAEVEDMKARDSEVRTHENAHKSAGGQYAASPSYTYETGPDGKRYITDGEVSIDVGKEDDPQDTIEKMQVVKRAAMAPAQPSAQDRQVYAEASQKEAEARQELAQEKQEEAQGSTNSSNAAANSRAQGTNAAAQSSASQGTSAQGNSDAGTGSARNGANGTNGGVSAQGLAPQSRTISPDDANSNAITNGSVGTTAPSMVPGTPQGASADSSTPSASSAVAQPTAHQGSGINAINNQAQRNVLDPASVPEPSVAEHKTFSA